MGMKCPNCHTENWENVDFARIKQTKTVTENDEKKTAPLGMSLCKECGFISYPDQWKTEEEIKKHYRSAYRNPPGHGNVFSGERKTHFHHVFLLELFEKWKAEGLENPKICEVGAAMGITLHWIRSIFPKAEIYGTELTTSFRRNAHHEFGINLTEDIDESKKYDLIISYKVLEHQLDPDVQLDKYRKCLSPTGHFYISVPTWFNSIYNFGLDGFDLEYYYDPNHINVWTKEMFEGMLANRGFEIIKNDQVIYASTYLCKPNEKLIGTPIVKEDPENIKSYLKKIRAAYMAYTQNKYDEAITLWPDYPQAHASRMEMSRKLMEERGWLWFRDTFIEAAIKACPNSAHALITATDFAMRAQKWQEAVKYCERALIAKPENPVSLHQMANIMRELALRGKDENEKQHYFNQAREVARHLRNVSSQHFREATDLIYLFNSMIPFKGEAAKALKSSDTVLPVSRAQKGKPNDQPQASL